MNRLDKLFYAVLIVATVAVLLWMSPECAPEPPAAPNSLEEILDEPNDDEWIEIDTTATWINEGVLTLSPEEIDRQNAYVDNCADEIIESIARRPEAIARLRELVCQKEDPNEADLFQFNVVDYNDALDLTQAMGSIEVYITAVDLVASDPEAIRKLAKDGCICKVLGHRWRGGRPGEEGVIYADVHPDTWYRTCTICGQCESQSMTEWGQ